MKKTSILKYLPAALLIISCALTGLTACNTDKEQQETESSTSTPEAPKEDFDFVANDMSQYVALDKSAYTNASVTVSDMYEITDANIEKYINGLLKEYPQKLTDAPKETDRPVQEGDTVYIYYEGLLDGKAFDGGTYAETSTSNPYALTIGSGSFIPGFEDGLIGVIPSETSLQTPFALNVTFPESYQNSPELAGKAVVFNVYIKYILNDTYIPEYNEDTVVNILEFKAEGDDVIKEFEDYIRSLLQDEQDQAVLTEISKLLINNLTVKSYPQESVDYWFASYSAEIQQQVDLYTMYGIQVTFDQMAAQMLGLQSGQDWKTELTKFAKETVKTNMVYTYIAQQNGLSVSDKEYNDKVDELVEYYSSNGQKVTREEIIEKIGEKVIRRTMLFEKVDDLLLSSCTVGFKKAESK